MVDFSVRFIYAFTLDQIGYGEDVTFKVHTALGMRRRVSYAQEGQLFHVLVSDGIAFLCMADEVGTQRQACCCGMHLPLMQPSLVSWVAQVVTHMLSDTTPGYS